MFPVLHDKLARPPWTLPRWLDAASERWWRAGPRTRVIVLAVVTGLGLAAVTGRIGVDPHGPPTTVLIAAHHLPLGHQLEPADLRPARWPRDLAPDGAVTGGDALALAGKQLTAPLPRGAVATEHHLGDTGLGEAVPPGYRAVAIPIDALPPLSSGTRLDLVTTDLDGRAVPIASDAIVVTSDPETVWLAVDPSQAAEAAAAGLSGSLGAIVRDPGS
jgi:pilus assembly protein CpaB